jgi:hydrogenase 3 maturation protease
MTSDASWKTDFHHALRQLLDAYREPRIAILGIGSQFHGDDASGIILARTLLDSGIEHPQLMVLSTGVAPENFTGLLRLFAPDLVLLVDAARMARDPGTVCLLDFEAIEGCSASTHTLPLHIFASYLADDLACRPALIGIQPADTPMGSPLSPAVQAAIDFLAYELTEMFRLPGTSFWQAKEVLCSD